ncbi:MAG: helix-turn-helix transcriptional regulator [Acidobacteriota bacterium]|nr:helix-turn-helix transcriptional regulator [Acidobacteriota bacterium]
MSEPGTPARQPRQVSDAQTMRALAHPLRLELLDLIRRDGEVTATRAAEQLGESPGNMSWHLQTLAKYGFVEEAGGGKGRSRPWRIAEHSNRFTAQPDDPGAAAAGTALAGQVLDRAVELQRQWMAERPAYPPGWQTAAFLNNRITYLTAAELREVCEELVAIVERHNDRVDKRKRPADAMPVQLTAFGHPLPPTESGN